MSQLLPLLFFAGIALNAYHTAKRQGRWSWPQFCVVIISLVAGPLLIIWFLAGSIWLQDKPGTFTLIAVTLILLFVCALAFALKRFWPLRPKSPP